MTEISSDVIRGYSDPIILYLLLESDSYGYEISKSIIEKSEEKYTMKETTLYSTFTRLQKNGYIESYYGDETQGRRRTYYRITNLGRTYYQEKCEEWKLTKQVVNNFMKEIDENGNY
ncbi:MAG: PadR family transcriptional regulator [Lachnospiraceae bacterium]|nr:PadR family transcriptional regulator [Lachnospiraceae bacterium]